MRLERRDPPGELHELDVAPLLLEPARAQPEQVRDHAAEASERDGDERDGGRHVGAVARAVVRQPRAPRLAQRAALGAACRHERDDRRRRRQLFEFAVHVFF